MSTMVTRAWVVVTSLLLLGSFTERSARATAFQIVDTGQGLCYDTTVEISCPTPGQPFHGQDAHYDGNQPSYTLSADGLTVYDNVTGLTWVASPDTDGDGILESPDDKLTWGEAQGFPATLNVQNFGGYSDWRLPTIKELYSLIDFTGIDPSGYTGGTSGLVPFIDTDYFEFEYGNESAGERVIDSQYASSNLYVGSSGPQQLLFGVNFADGRIKGYGLTMPGGLEKTFFVMCTRDNTSYGANDFVDNGDGTVTDDATGLMWQQDDSGNGMFWEDALAYAEGLAFAGHDDWRLPNAKELQGILDYSRSPSTHGTAAIDPVFGCTAITDEGGDTNFPFYWSGTTHANWSPLPGAFGAYVCFGEALGYMNGSWVDVHGAGAQRSDPKEGDPADWPFGHGPQGDAIRIFNFVRCVRDASPSIGVGDGRPDARSGLHLEVAPNPLNLTARIAFSVSEDGPVTLAVYDLAGRLLRTLVGESMTVGEYSVVWDGRGQDARNLPSGIYFARLASATAVRVMKVLLAR